jgi:hypothetical protein
MTDYRVYFIGGDDHIFAAENIEAADDQAAIAMAEHLCAGQPGCRGFEVWERARQVHRYWREEAA